VRVVLDAGALAGVEHGDRVATGVMRDELAELRVPLTHAGIVAEVWRGGRGRQARLAQALRGVEIRPIDDELGRRAGVLLGRIGRADVMDAALVLLAENGDAILTADPDDLREFAEAAGKDVDLIRV
jgi:hypothetical protein